RVPSATIARGIDELFSLHQTIAQLGHRPSTGQCTITLDAPHTGAREELRLQPNEALCRVQRIRLADDRPVILCDDYLPQRLLRHERARSSSLSDLAREIAKAGSLYLWLEERVGASIDSAMAHIESINAAPEQAASLDLP